MSKNFNTLENIFRILHQDHTYFLACPDLAKHKEERIEKCDIPRLSLNYDGNVAGIKIMKFLCSVRNRRIYQRIKSKLFKLQHQNPMPLIKRLDYMCYTLFEKDNYVLVFRLAGESFPPCIVYKVFNRLYAVSSFRFPVLKPKLKKSREKEKRISETTLDQDKRNGWKICYVHKEERRVLKAPRVRRKTNSLTWIREKYGC